MNKIDHLVLAGHDLGAMRATYGALGFTLCPPARHPFGTANTAIQLEGNYLELLSLAAPEQVPEHGPARFSFAAFNRDYLARHDGFAMLVLGTEDADADIARWRAAGLRTYERFDFSRPAKTAGGEDVTVGFSLAFASSPSAPWLGIFACQHFSPGYFAQAEYQRHANTARGVADVWVSGAGAEELAGYFETLAGAAAERLADRIEIRTAAGTIVLASPETFRSAFGVAPPHPEDGPHLAGLTVACRDLAFFGGLGLMEVGDRLVLPPDRCFGTALAFMA
jgi:hypothetical protein